MLPRVRGARKERKQHQKHITLGGDSVPEPDGRSDQLRVGTTGKTGWFPSSPSLSPFPSLSHRETQGALFCVLGWPRALSPIDSTVIEVLKVN